MRVLCCPLASHGFVYPSIAIGLALREKGHEVAFATGPAFTEILQGEGLERIPRTERDGFSFQVTLWGSPEAIALQVKHIQYAIQRFRPDVLVASELALGAILVAEMANLPVALIGLAAFPWPALLRDSARSDPETLRRQEYLFNERRKLFNRARRLIGMAESEAGCRDSPLLGDRLLLQAVPELADGGEVLLDRVSFVGSCLWAPAAAKKDEQLLAWLSRQSASGRSILYAQQGRCFNVPAFWPNLVLASDQASVAASLGRSQAQVEVSSLPQTAFARPHIEQSLILPHVSGVISSGNTTSVLGALESGLPMVLLPAGGEQPELAACCERLGVASLLCPRSVTPAIFQSAIKDLLEDSGKRLAAARLQEAFRAVDGPSQAAKAIENLYSGVV